MGIPAFVREPKFFPGLKVNWNSGMFRIVAESSDFFCAAKCPFVLCLRSMTPIWPSRQSARSATIIAAHEITVLVILSTRMKTRGLLRDTIHLSIGQGFRLVIQAAYFILIARSLGPDAYGAFVTVVAMAALLGPFSGLGTANLFIKNVRSNKREATICWGNGILLTVFSGSLLSALGLGLSLALHLKTAPLRLSRFAFQTWYC